MKGTLIESLAMFKYHWPLNNMDGDTDSHMQSKIHM